MKTIKEYINEALVFEAYNAEDVCKKIQSTKEFRTKVKASDIPDKLYVLKFNKTDGEFIDLTTYNNDKSYAGKDGYCVWCVTNDNKPNNYIYWVMNKQYKDCSLSVDIIVNTKKSGIVIGYFDDANTEIIKNFVKDNLKSFDSSSDGLTQDEIDQLDKFFSETVKNYEKKLDKKTFAAYFPSRKEAGEKLGRLGYDNIPHLTISRPNSYKGNLKVTSYRSGNWAATEWPDMRRMMNDDGTPKYANIDSIINYLKKVVEQNGDRLGIELK